MPPDRGEPGGETAAGHPPTRTDPGQDLVRRALSGDSRAFDELVLAHQDAVFGLISRLVREKAIAEELTQDTFIRAWRGLKGFRGEARFSTWLYRIAVNLCRDHHGSRETRQRRSESSLDDPGGVQRSIRAGDPTPQERLEEREMARAFEQALEGLDPAHREAFLLRHQEGLSPAEIAEALGISVTNAKVRVHRAREAILSTLRSLGHAV